MPRLRGELTADGVNDILKACLSACPRGVIGNIVDEWTPWHNYDLESVGRT